METVFSTNTVNFRLPVELSDAVIADKPILWIIFKIMKKKGEQISINMHSNKQFIHPVCNINILIA